MDITPFEIALYKRYNAGKENIKDTYICIEEIYGNIISIKDNLNYIYNEDEDLDYNEDEDLDCNIDSSEFILDCKAIINDTIELLNKGLNEDNINSDQGDELLESLNNLSEYLYYLDEEDEFPDIELIKACKEVAEKILNDFFYSNDIN